MLGHTVVVMGDVEVKVDILLGPGVGCIVVAVLCWSVALRRKVAVCLWAAPCRERLSVHPPPNLRVSCRHTQLTQGLLKTQESSQPAEAANHDCRNMIQWTFRGREGEVQSFVGKAAAGPSLRLYILTAFGHATLAGYQSISAAKSCTLYCCPKQSFLSESVVRRLV